MTTLALFAMLFAFLILGLPVAIALGLSAITTIFFFSNDTLASVALKLFEALSEHYTLLAIPFFILSSVFLSIGSIARRLIRFATAVVGHVRGGLAMASALPACCSPPSPARRPPPSQRSARSSSSAW